MAERGLLGPSVRDRVDEFLLGFVEDPMTGHERYRGMLAIPYLRPHDDLFVASIRFRCVTPGCEHKGHGKYNTVSGEKQLRMFNTEALLRSNDQIAVTEGEFDAITAELSGVRAVGLPGATTWRPEFRPPFLGYETVWILSDGDKAGEQFADKILKELPNARQLPCPDGEDVNSLVLKHGPAALTERMK